MTLSNLYTKKQTQVIKTLNRNDWKLMINYGAVRSGKTVVDNDIFLLELLRIKEVADKLGVSEPMYILAGYSSKSIQNNVLQELSNKYGIEFKFDKHNSFKLFGVKVVQTFTGSISGLGAIRGMTSFGAYINEASLANELVFDEIKKRCSAPNARIVCDTNPDQPQHWLKKNYIDNKDPDAGIVSYHFILDDNTFLPPDYVRHEKAGTPKGMFYDRDILGLWVSGEGMVYQDFNKKQSAVKAVPDGLTYYCGIDWGYEHKGSIVVLGDDTQGNTYLVEEHTKQHQEIDYWVKVAKGIQQRYGRNIRYYADSARPEHVQRFIREGLHTINADKNIMAGIETVAKLIKTGHFYYVETGIQEFLDEIYQYIWDEKKGMPVKDEDHAMDALRYAYYTKHNRKPVSIMRR